MAYEKSTITNNNKTVSGVSVRGYRERGSVETAGVPAEMIRSNGMQVNHVTVGLHTLGTACCLLYCAAMILTVSVTAELTKDEGLGVFEIEVTKTEGLCVDLWTSTYLNCIIMSKMCFLYIFI